MFAHSATAAQDVYIPSPSSLIWLDSSSCVLVKLQSPFSSETPFPCKGGSKGSNRSQVRRHNDHDYSTIKGSEGRNGHPRGGFFTSWISSPIVETQGNIDNITQRDWKKSGKGLMVISNWYEGEIMDKSEKRDTRDYL